ncbi:acetyl/propionyl/methylcrotonyl-CoA carboxylase subunit alpha [Pararhodobacter sp.]|uniref:acetyl/propionyl/methylcrotonyl-CoA carboxylase subunit alpha n=1 Tax=Pararhodobacter sp. TaxID=2127056 RepID=UPI002FDDFCDD
MSFDTILIANRGEIACRIIRTARAMGYRTVAVFTDPDAGAPHVLAADAAVQIGPARAYLEGARIIAAAKRMGAGAVHPGYGFLSENAGFARACQEAGLVFIGPGPEAIALMGSKAEAKQAMARAGVPCLPGYAGRDQSDAVLLAEGARLGFPLMVKAAMGGGGKGMRLVREAGALAEALARARSEAEKAFGDGTLILERALKAPRHVEIQVLADGQGNVVHLGERDCSVQRRHQKVVEEAPSPAVDAELRAAMGAAAVQAARACRYVGAGTVEFLLEGGAFHFLEMNTRLQVEHPVTEAVTGIDLVEWQIRVARGEALPWRQEEIALEGHAIEVRLYAEDPAQGFLPQAGRLLRWRPAPGLRVDHGLAEGQEVSADYDPLLAKLIAHGPDRDTARRRLIRGLEETGVLGLRTNKAFLINLLRDERFARGEATTAFLEREFAGDASLAPAVPGAAVLALAALVFAARRGGASDPAHPRFGWGNGSRPRVRFRLAEGAVVHEVGVSFRRGAAGLALDYEGGVLEAVTLEPGLCRYLSDGQAGRLIWAFEGDVLHLEGFALRDVTHAPAEAADTRGDGVLRAPMAGTVISVAVAPGDAVEKGQVLAVLEAMKMEHPLRAGLSGRVDVVSVTTGSQVKARQVLLEIEGDGK